MGVEGKKIEFSPNIPKRVKPFSVVIIMHPVPMIF